MTHRGASLSHLSADRLVTGLSLANTALFSVLVTGQWLVWSALPGHHAGRPTWLVVGQGTLVLATTLLCGAVPVLLWQVLPRRLRVRQRLYVTGGIVAACACAVPVALVLSRVDETAVDGDGALLLWVTVATSYAIALTTALAAGGLLDRWRRAEHARVALQRRAARAVASLEREEVRVRRLVADRLHGTIQNRLVVAGAGLQEVATDLARGGDPGRAAGVQRWVDDLDDLRERHVRAISHALFPVGANVGMLQAVQVLLNRLPARTGTALDVRPAARVLLRPDVRLVPVPVQLIAVYAVEEAVTNALKHGAGAVRVVVDLDGDPEEPTLVVDVEDDGPGLRHPVEPLNGLERHRVRIVGRGGTFALGPAPDGGARLRFSLPLGDEPPAADLAADLGM
ncbi:sensor histidine kinase [Cellulomonas triticagri]|uniref:sensor histidine kinase n=1 Tax=Cellulomonas triticagri TaxID=2483352 RepID=UPI0013158589|nr:ATP-binding protein [Cellulomonas triticagri]